MEIRDSRNGSWYWVNTAVNACTHITPIDKVVYGALCTFAGYSEIRPAYEEIAVRSAVSLRRCKESVQKLIKVGIISVEKGGGKGKSNVYTLLKCSKGCGLCTVSNGAENSTQTVRITTPYGAPNAPHIDRYIDTYKDNEAAEAATEKKVKIERKWKIETPMDLKDFVFWARKSPQKHVQVIAEWAEAEGPKYETYGQWQAFISRNARVAARLTPFTILQIEEAYGKMAKDIKSSKNPDGFITKYTLETLEKYL